MSTLTNWRDLPAGRDLDRAIAERLGWRVENFNPRPNGIMIKTINSWMLLPPGKDADWWIRDPHAGYVSERDAWAHSQAYSTDLNAAMTLLDTAPQWGVTRTFEHFDCYIAPGNGVLNYYGRAETPALAVCRAWIRWQEALLANDA
jgi:hypothetical protein